MENTFYFDAQGNSEVYVKIIEGKHFLGKVKNIITFVTFKITTVNNHSPS